MKINAAWRAKRRMAKNPSLAQRIESHLGDANHWWLPANPAQTGGGHLRWCTELQ
jgi:hypothetical protein